MACPSARSPVGEHVLAVHAQAEAGDGDADLRGGNVAVLSMRILQHRLNQRAPAYRPRRARVDGRPRRADDRELRRDEEAR